MFSDPKDCLYCQNNETLHNLMIEIAHLRVSRAFSSIPRRSITALIPTN